MQPETNEFIVIIPTDQPGPPPTGEAIRAALEGSFPGYIFRIVGSSDLQPAFIAEGGAERFRYEHMVVMPVMNSRTLEGDPTGVMIMNAPPPSDLVEAIALRLETLEAGNFAN